MPKPSRYEQEQKKRDVHFGGQMIGRRQATTEEAARELGAAFADLGDHLIKIQVDFLRRINDALARR